MSQWSNHNDRRGVVQQLGTAYDRHGIQGTVDVWDTHFLSWVHGNNDQDAANHLLVGEVLTAFAKGEKSLAF